MNKNKLFQAFPWTNVEERRGHYSHGVTPAKIAEYYVVSGRIINLKEKNNILKS
jgi:hypothetical protein